MYEVYTSVTEFAGMAICLNMSVKQEQWTIDFGASSYMTSNVDLVSNPIVVNKKLTINLTKGDKSLITHYGD